jgi:hypothetical protein
VSHKVHAFCMTRQYLTVLRPGGMRFFVTGDVMKLERPRSSWLKVFDHKASYAVDAPE